MLTREQCREIDRKAIEELGIPGIVLMENAGRGCSEVILNELRQVGHSVKESRRGVVGRENRNFKLLPNAKPNDLPVAVVICCGPGNNGGDGFVIARHLAIADVPVKVILLGARERYRGDALINLRVVERLHLPIIDFNPELALAETITHLEFVRNHKVSWIVDALLGTGSQGALNNPIRQAVVAMNLVDAKRLAVDLPTGMDCNTGNIEGEAVRADITCTFVDRKTGFANQQANPYLGEVVVISIGAPA